MKKKYANNNDIIQKNDIQQNTILVKWTATNSQVLSF